MNECKTLLIQKCATCIGFYLILLCIDVEEQKKNITKFLPNVDEIKQLVVGSGISGMQRMMNEKLEQWREVKVNLAILGASGVGKSSFINAIRG